MRMISRDVYGFSQRAPDLRMEQTLIKRGYLAPFVVHEEEDFVGAGIIDTAGNETALAITLDSYTVSGARSWVFEGASIDNFCGVFYIKLTFGGDVTLYSKKLFLHEFSDESLSVAVMGTCGNNFTDHRDTFGDTIEGGEVYPTVQIGGLCWMTENFRYEPYMRPFTAPNGNPANVASYGYLYGQTAVKSSTFLPQGWRIPTWDDWRSFERAHGAAVVGGMMKEVGTTYWDSPNEGATNVLGFNARGAGGFITSSSYFKERAYITGMGDTGIPFMVMLTKDSAGIQFLAFYSNRWASVRLVRDAVVGATVPVPKKDPCFAPLRFSVVQDNSKDNLLICSMFEPVPFVFRALTVTTGTIEVWLEGDDGSMEDVTEEIPVEQGTFNGDYYYYFIGGLVDWECGVYRLIVKDGDLTYYSVWFRNVYTMLPPEPAIIEVFGQFPIFECPIDGTVTHLVIVRGRNLTAPITVHAPALFLLSIPSSGEFNPLLIYPDGEGRVDVVLTAKFSPTAEVDGDGFLELTSGIARKVEHFMMWRTVEGPLVVLSGILNQFVAAVGQWSPFQEFRVQGYNLTAPVTLTAPAGFMLSAYYVPEQNPITFNPHNGLVDRMINIRWKPTAEVDDSGFIEAVSSGAEQADKAISWKTPVPFIMKVKTNNTGTSNDNQFTIPTTGEGYNYTVERCDADGNVLQTLTNQTGNVTLTWDSAGTYLVKIPNGVFPRIFFNNQFDKSKLIGVTWGDMKWSSMNSAFNGCNNLVEMTGEPDLSGVTDMSYMFYRATSFNQNIGGWNTATVTNMSYMFFQASAFNQNIGGWDVSKVTNMSSMFLEATNFNQNIGGWDVSKVTNMLQLFQQATAFNQNISAWDVSKVTNMGNMFRQASAFNQNIGGWDTVKVTDMNQLFYQATSFNQNIGGWNTAAVTNMSFMFRQASAFNQNIGGWNTGVVANMGVMFYQATSFNQDLSGWCVTLITTKPANFDTGATAWVLADSRPVWGTCP